MHAFKSLAIIATDNGDQRGISISLLNGPNRATTCYAYKRFDLAEAAEVRSIIGWASLAFLTAADELHEDGWQVVHMPECPDHNPAVLDA